ncbi:glycerophosphodiester phosphodiesterase [Guggenheimella bovis]
MKFVAHRGFSYQHTENSLDAIRYALTTKAHGIEIDIHETKDREIVVHHDFILGRTVEGTGRLKDYTLSELKGFKLKGSEGSIPSLKEVLETIDGKKELVIEVKGEVDLDLLHETLKGYDPKCFRLESFDHKLIRKWNDEYPGFHTGLIVYGRIQDPLEYLKMTKASFYSFSEEFFNREDEAFFSASKVDSLIWGINDLKTLSQYEGRDTLYVVTDNSEILNEKALDCIR